MTKRDAFPTQRHAQRNAAPVMERSVAATSGGAPRRAGLDVPRVAVLGVNVWAVLLAIPLAYGPGPLDWARASALALPLAVLAAGTLTLRRLSAGARWLLLAGFPSAVAVVMAARPELRALDAYPPLGLALGALSLAAFGGAAAFAIGRPRATRHTTRQPLASPPSPLPGAARRTLARRLLLGGATVGALALVAVAPALGGRAGATRAWSDAAEQGALLASVVGSALATIVLGVFVGPALRANRARTEPRTSGRRVVLALLVVASGAVAYGLYVRAR